MARDTSPAAKATYRLLKAKRTSGWSIDVVESATDAWPRERISAQLTAWEGAGLVDVSGRQVRAVCNQSAVQAGIPSEPFPTADQRFQIVKPLPKTIAEQEAIAEEMYKGMVTREEDAVVRMKKVIEFATQEECRRPSLCVSILLGWLTISKGLSQSLAAYFGDKDVVPNLGMCQHCSYCLTLKGALFDTTFSTVADHNRLKLVLSACLDRDDPRLLTRLAFGITSPRLTATRLTSHAVFGSMVDVDFDVLLAAFTKVCNEEGNLPATPDVNPSQAKPSARKTSTGSTKRTGGSTSQGRGTGSMRGRSTY